MGAKLQTFLTTGKDQANFPLDAAYKTCTKADEATKCIVNTALLPAAKTCCMYTEFLTEGTSTAAKLEAYQLYQLYGYPRKSYVYSMQCDPNYPVTFSAMSLTWDKNT